MNNARNDNGRPIHVPQMAVPQPDIDDDITEILGRFLADFDGKDNPFIKAKQALYQRLLEVIGADEDIDPLKTEVSVSLEAFAHNELRAAQRKALAELMGMAE